MTIKVTWCLDCDRAATRYCTANHNIEYESTKQATYHEQDTTDWFADCREGNHSECMYQYPDASGSVDANGAPYVITCTCPHHRERHPEQVSSGETPLTPEEADLVVGAIPLQALPDGPIAPERGATNAEQVKALAANWNQKSRLEQITARHKMYDLSGIPNGEYTASWEDVELLIEQQRQLVEVLRLIQGFDWQLDDSPHGLEVKRRAELALSAIEQE